MKHKTHMLMEKKQLRELQRVHGAWNSYCESMRQFKIPFSECQTKGLLVLLQEARVLRQREISYLKEQRQRPGYESYVKNHEEEDIKYHEEEQARLEVVIVALRKELATREHVPRKQEAKNIRQEKAKKR